MSYFIQLESGEKATVEVAPRAEAIAFLSKPALRRDWFGRKFKALHRHNRGPGGAVDYLNIGLRVGDTWRAIVRYAPGPWRNAPIVAAVGADLAPYTAYLMRLLASGISRDDLVSFLTAANALFPEEYLRRRPDKPRFRYVVSLDSISGWLIEGEAGKSLLEAPPAAGLVYNRCGALYAGQTKSQPQPTRYIDDDGLVRSVYKAGHNTIGDLPAGTRLLKNDAKHRFVFVLAEPGSLSYRAYRASLPAWVQEYKWGEFGLGWMQPRLLVEGRQFGGGKQAYLRPAAA